MSQNKIKYSGNKYLSIFDPKETTNLYDMAKDYKKKLDEFDKNITLNETIIKNRQRPSVNVVKDVYSATSKFFSRKFLMYDTTVIKFSELQKIFEYKNDFMIFDNKRIIDFLNFIYAKLNLGIKANSDLNGKKVNLYFPLTSNSNWFIRKYISIESSSAPIEITDVTELEPNDLTNVSSYNVKLESVQNNASVLMDVNGGKISVKRINDDVSTWVKSVYTKTTSSSESKKMGWGKTIVDLTLYNNFLIDVYKQSDTKPSPDSNVEISFPIYVCLEDLFTNSNLYNKYNATLFDNANFFNYAYLRLLQKINAPDDSILKKYIDISSKEDKSTKKIITNLSKVMSLYLSLKKSYVGILRKIRALFDGFSIKELNNLLNSINAFNNKRNYVKKKKSVTDSYGAKTTNVFYEYYNLKTLEKFVDAKNLAVISKEIISNDIKWGHDKFFNLWGVDEISSAIKALSSYYNENRYLDPLNYFSIISAEAIVADVSQDLKETKTEKIEKDIMEFNALSISLVDGFESRIKKEFDVDPYKLLKVVSNKYDTTIANFIKRLTNLTIKYVNRYLEGVSSDMTVDAKNVAEYINKNLSSLYFLETKKILGSSVVGFITKGGIAYPIDDKEIQNILEITDPSSNDMTEDSSKIYTELSAEKIKLIDIRGIYKDNYSAFIALLGNIENWAYGTDNLLKSNLDLWNRTPTQIFKEISNISKLPFKAELSTEFEEYERKMSKVMDNNFSNLLKIGEIVSTRLRKGLINIIDMESLKQKKISDPDVVVKRDESGIAVNKIIIPSNAMELENNEIMENINNIAEEIDIHKNDNLDIREDKDIVKKDGNVIVKVDGDSSTANSTIASNTKPRGRSKIKNDNPSKSNRVLSMLGKRAKDS